MTSQALIVYQPMDLWAQNLAQRGERRETALNGPTTECPLNRAWQVSVKVVTAEPIAPDGSVAFGARFARSVECLQVGPVEAGDSDELVIDGEGPDTGESFVREIPHWDVVDAPTIALPADDGRLFEVSIRAHCWVGLRVRRHDRDAVVPGVKVAHAWADARAPRPSPPTAGSW